MIWKLPEGEKWLELVGAAGMALLKGGLPVLGQVLGNAIAKLLAPKDPPRRPPRPRRRKDDHR